MQRNTVKTLNQVLLAVWMTGLLAVGTAQANTCTWTGTWDTPPAAGDVIVIASGNLTWSSSMPSNVASWTQVDGYAGTVTVQTVYSSSGFTNLTVTGDMTLNGGVLMHMTNSTAESRRLRITVNGNLLITNAAISGDSCGYIAQNGPGGFGVGAASGGAHGGAAAGDSLFVNKQTYGSIIAPTNLGSGGVSSTASPGGGAILLTVAGTTTVATAGMITANGGSSGNRGGSGGSIYLTTGWLTGSGTIQAKGGGAALNNGGGGRVAIILTGTDADFTTSWSGTNIAFGGGSAGNAGAAGTVYRKTTAGVDTLIIDNNNNISIAGACSTLMPPVVNLNSFANVEIKNMGILGVKGDTTLDFNTFHPTVYGSSQSAIAIDSDANVTYPANWIVNNYTLYVKTVTPNKMVNLTVSTNGAISQFKNFGSETYKLNLTIAGNLTVLSNGVINANALGYYNQNGPGYLPVNNMGGAYGGHTLVGATVNTQTYGRIIAPVNLGSGSYGAAGGAAGGGAVLLTVGGTTTVASAGVITANGGNSTAGGSGGSIALTTGWLIGSGAVRANGGSTGGSGGRVAIILTGAGANFNLWTGANTATGNIAAAGTVYRQEPANLAGAGTVIVDNGSIATNLAFTCLPAFSGSSESLSQTMWVVTNKTRLGLVANVVIASLNLATTNSYLELAGCTGMVSFLTITNHLYKNGIYSASALGGLVADSSGGNGRVVVYSPPRGTLISVR